MKWWFHIIAGALGLGLAAVIVTLVFGNASNQGTTTGPAPVQEGNAGGSNSGTDCASINPASVTDQAIINKAANELPTISQGGKSIAPKQADQITWFARLYAASGLCIDEIDVSPASLTISTGYPATLPLASVDAFSYATLSRAFDPPLARRSVKLDVQVGSQMRRAVVTIGAWQAFQRARAARKLPPSMAGLAASKRKLAYAKNEVALTGW